MQLNESARIFLCESSENTSRGMAHNRPKVVYVIVLVHAQWKTYQDLRKEAS